MCHLLVLDTLRDKKKKKKKKRKKKMIIMTMTPSPVSRYSFETHLRFRETKRGRDTERETDRQTDR